MGRGKLNLKLISNRKSRMSTFKKRKNSLLKKSYELSTLCDVRMCVLINGPSSDDDRSHSDLDFHTWPTNRSEIQTLIRAYKINLRQKRKGFDLSDFFSDRKAKIETEILKLRQNLQEVVRPNWDDQLDHLSEQELRAFMDALDSKIETVTGMIQFSSNSVQMEARDFNPPVDELEDFNGSEDRPAFNSEDLQSLFFEEGDDIDMEFIMHCRNLMNDEFDYANNLEHLMMAGTSTH